ncbi:MAG: glycogen synthase GlgA [Acidobacteria bacterium]|nr:glycogen synthase GlgA [Acidobacteriota bacterium]
MGIVMVASEVSPYAKTGGLADVTGALPAALGDLGHDVTIVLPRYRGVSLPGAAERHRHVRIGSVSEDVTFLVAEPDRHRRIVMVDAPRYFDREGFYTQGGRDYPDNAERFALLCAAALDFAEYEMGTPVDVVHAHDWQGGLAPALLRVLPERFPRLRRAGIVFTIHNLAYQGLFPRDVVPRLELPWSVFTIDTGEFYSQLSYLKAGIMYSDYVTTVSPSYARETLEPEFGAGLEGALQARRDRYVGILNGIDTAAWNPQTDPYLPAPFDADHLEGKAACKRALLERFGFAQGDDRMARPLIGMVSRLVEQKGMELIEQASERLAECDATWVFLGTGEARYEQFLRDWAARQPARVGVHIGFSEPLAHLVEAGADMFLMPSTFEPCGLNQMYSLRYGAVPIVRAVGGLDDTIQPYTARAIGANGFKFKDATPEALVRAVRQAVRLFRDKEAWLPLVRNGMGADHSWATSAREYVKVYRRARLAVESRSGR